MFKDNFSAQSSVYARFRPGYPDALINYILTHVSERGQALDVATGNGQVAALLSPYFEKVFATDISQKQLDNAVSIENIEYSRQPAENTTFSDSQFDLITVAQAIHWFDFDAFYKEVFRVLKPEGLFVVIGYGLFTTNPDTDKILAHFYHDIVGPYWDAERRYLDENYKTIPFPFTEIYTDEVFVNQFSWTFEQLTGYLQSWSAVQHYINKNGKNPLNIIHSELKESWEARDNSVTFPLLLRLGKRN